MTITLTAGLAGCQKKRITRRRDPGNAGPDPFAIWGVSRTNILDHATQGSPIPISASLWLCGLPPMVPVPDNADDLDQSDSITKEAGRKAM